MTWHLYDERTHAVVTIPCDRRTFRDDGTTLHVEAIESFPSPGRSGKLYVRAAATEPLRTVYLGVVGCYIAEEPHTDEAAAS